MKSFDWLKKQEYFVHYSYGEFTEKFVFIGPNGPDRISWFSIDIPRTHKDTIFFETYDQVKEFEQLPTWFQEIYQKAEKQVEERDR